MLEDRLREAEPLRVRVVASLAPREQHCWPFSSGHHAVQYG